MMKWFLASYLMQELWINQHILNFTILTQTFLFVFVIVILSHDTCFAVMNISWTIQLFFLLTWRNKKGRALFPGSWSRTQCLLVNMHLNAYICCKTFNNIQIHYSQRTIVVITIEVLCLAWFLLPVLELTEGPNLNSMVHYYHFIMGLFYNL